MMQENAFQLYEPHAQSILILCYYFYIYICVDEMC